MLSVARPHDAVRVHGDFRVWCPRKSESTTTDRRLAMSASKRAAGVQGRKWPRFVKRITGTELVQSSCKGRRKTPEVGAHRIFRSGNTVHRAWTDHFRWSNVLFRHVRDGSGGSIAVERRVDAALGGALAKRLL